MTRPAVPGLEPVFSIEAEIDDIIVYLRSLKH